MPSKSLMAGAHDGSLVGDTDGSAIEGTAVGARGMTVATPMLC